MTEDGSGDYRFEARTLTADYVCSLFKRRSLDPEYFVAQIGERLYITVVVFHHVDFSRRSSKLGAYVTLSDGVTQGVLRIDDENLEVVRSMLQAQHNCRLVEAQPNGKIRLLLET